MFGLGRYFKEKEEEEKVEVVIVQISPVMENGEHRATLYGLGSDGKAYELYKGKWDPVER